MLKYEINLYVFASYASRIILTVVHSFKYYVNVFVTLSGFCNLTARLVWNIFQFLPQLFSVVCYISLSSVISVVKRLIYVMHF